MCITPPPLPTRFWVIYADGLDLDDGRVIGDVAYLPCFEHLEDAIGYIDLYGAVVEANYGPGVQVVIDLHQAGKVVARWGGHTAGKGG